MRDTDREKGRDWKIKRPLIRRQGCAPFPEILQKFSERQICGECAL